MSDKEDKVVNFSGITRLDIPPERILRGALKRDLESVVVMGWTKDGDTYFASGMADGGDVMWLMRKCEQVLLSGGYDD